MRRVNYLLITVHFLIMNPIVIFSTIDVNLSELEYLAAHLSTSECQKLIAALHYTTYELPENLTAAERNVNKDIPCLRHLLHWNMSPNEGRGKTHEEIEHRLRQLHRNDLADWLGKTTFIQLGKDLEKIIKKPFGELEEQKTETTYPITLDPPDEFEEEDSWLPFDTLMLALFVGLFGMLIILIGTIAVQKLHHIYMERKFKTKTEFQEIEEARKVKSTTRGETSTESETDDDLNTFQKR